MIKQTLTITEITNVFPEECQKMIPRVNSQLKKQLKPFFIHCKSIRNRFYDNFTESFLLQVIRIFYEPKKIEKSIRRNQMVLDSMNTPEDDRITDIMIERAKETPIATLYDFQGIRSGNARFNAACPFHQERTGSFFVYPNNTYYCFGCHCGGDVIAFIRKLHGFGFPEAVRYLLKQ